MMIMGETCTRACSFCNVATGKPDALDPFEPVKVADAVAKLGLEHVVVTSVDRDDLDDGGAEHIANTIRAIRRKRPEATIEVLTPDFLRKDGGLEIVVEARPDVLVMDDMRAADVDFLTIGQYLQPTKKHYPVREYITPEAFSAYETAAYAKGFSMVSASPLTRSSYHAGDDFRRLRAARLASNG